jgi:hypothetical protein
MAFWSDVGLEPKRQFKFQVNFTGIGTNAKFLAQSADRPVFTISDGVKVDFLDKSFHYPGKVTWNQVKIKFVDTVGVGRENLARRTYDYLQGAGWVSPGATVIGPTAFLGTINKGSAVRNAGTVQVSVLDSDGSQVDIWALKNAFITTVALNNLDYAQEGILTAEYTFRYDWAELSTPFDAPR